MVIRCRSTSRPSFSCRLDPRRCGSPRRARVIRVIAAATVPELAGRCANPGEYAESDAERRRVRSLARPAGRSPHSCRTHWPSTRSPRGASGRIFRCSTVMVNVLPESDDPRDPSKLSPHHHDDFEQVSLQVVGDYVHHMRVAWTPDSTTWRDDEHGACQAPAIVVIPPPLIHTSQAVGAMRHWLIDVFAPPRPRLLRTTGLGAERRRVPDAVT